MATWQVKPPRINDPILFEVYFAKFFPVEEFIAGKVMQRTQYGITLTREFKNLLVEKMRHLGIDANVYEKFRNRQYAEIPLKRLWLPIVSAVCQLHNRPCTISDGKAYVEEISLNETAQWASAVYIWFRHVQKAQSKTRKKKAKTKGNYV